MNVATASPGKWARQGISDMSHSKEYCYASKNRHHIRQVVQLAKYTLVHETLAGSQVAVVADMMCAIVAIGLSGTTLPLCVVVEGNGKRHWQIHQYQQPGKPHSSLVGIAHSHNLLLWSQADYPGLWPWTVHLRQDKGSIVFWNRHHKPPRIELI